MKTFAAIVLLAAGLGATHAAQAAESSLELVLSDERVVFNSATNISMEMIFRNVGETNLSPSKLLLELAVVLDGKEFKRDPKRMPSLNILLSLEPKRAWRSRISLSDFLIPPAALAPGQHTVALSDMGSESNPLTIFIEPFSRVPLLKPPITLSNLFVSADGYCLGFVLGDSEGTNVSFVVDETAPSPTGGRVMLDTTNTALYEGIKLPLGGEEEAQLLGYLASWLNSPSGAKDLGGLTNRESSVYWVRRLLINRPRTIRIIREMESGDRRDR
jgi:hypothetical protein